ncbi:hypothetical protein ACI2KR_31110 [Pseudomonas luteola]
MGILTSIAYIEQSSNSLSFCLLLLSFAGITLLVSLIFLSPYRKAKARVSILDEFDMQNLDNPRNFAIYALNQTVFIVQNQNKSSAWKNKAISAFGNHFVNIRISEAKEKVNHLMVRLKP